MTPLTVLEGVALVASNLALVPAVYYAVRWHLIPEVAVLAVVLAVSTFYHLCQAGFVCALGIGFRTFQLADHFFVYGGLLWVVLFFLGLRLRFRFSILIVAQAFAFPLLVEFSHRWWFSLLVIAVVTVVALLLIAFSAADVRDFSAANFVAAAVLVLAGFALHLLAGDPPEPDGDRSNAARYAWLHSLWHVLAMLAVYYALDLRRKVGWLARAVEGARRAKRAPPKLAGVTVV